MLSVQSPLQLAMPNDSIHDDDHLAWNAWRAPTNLPTPPSSVPPRRLGTSKQHCFVDYDRQQRAAIGNGVDGGHDQHLTLPPITHLDRHWPNSSPLTPPDDEMKSSPLSLSLWRDAKPGPSRLHSPMTANPSPLFASPSPSPVDDDERYDERYDDMDDQPECDEPVNQEWEQEEQEGLNDHHTYHHQLQTSDPDTQGVHSHAADWITNTSQRSAHFIAEKTCEMVCYLWFSSSLGPRAAAASRARRERERSQRRRVRDAPTHQGAPRSPTFASRSLSNPSTAALQFCASPEFVAFMAKLLATTQVSQSVIVLSLHYIYRLKERNDFTLGKPGSEFRVAVCALMLANKFVDDNTYTNKTWSDVSAIPLEELNKMEREFLLGIGFRLFVDAQTYDAWLNLLKGLILAKEREHYKWRERRRARVMVPRIRIPDSNECVRIPQQYQQQRARSTSPHRSRNYAYAPAYPFTFAVPSSSATEAQSHTQSLSTNTSPNRPVSSKRTAADAFSPTSATFAGAARGGKRPTGLALDIGAALASASSSNRYRNAEWERIGSVSAQPAYAYADSLRELEKMSLATPIERQAGSGIRHEDPSAVDEARSTQREDQTLAAPYRGADAARRPPPPHLYFYALASSPLHSPYVASANAYALQPSLSSCCGATETNGMIGERHEEESYPLPAGAERKARLRYVDNRSSESSEYGQCSYGCCQAAPQSQSHSVYGSYEQAPRYPSTTTYPSSTTYSTDSYTQARTYVQHPSQQFHSQAQPHPSLPPLALALSMAPAPSSVPSVQAQSERTSPLPGCAAFDAYSRAPLSASHIHQHLMQQDESKQLPPLHQAYVSPPTYPVNPVPELSTAYAHAPAPAPAAQSSWSAPPSETVDGAYAPPRHVLPYAPAYRAPQHRSEPTQQQPDYLRSYTPPPYAYVPPQHRETSGDYAANTRDVPSQYPSHSQVLPERAAFANAGPPGVAHFYAYAYGRSGLSNEYSVTYSTGISGICAPVGMIQQSQSVNTSPNVPYVYDNDCGIRGRRL